MDFLIPLVRRAEEFIIYIVISLFMAVSVVLVVDTWRKSFNYFFAACIFGSIFGIAVSQIEIVKQWAFLASMLGTVTGPATLARMHGKSFTQAASEAANDLNDVVDAIKRKQEK